MTDVFIEDLQVNTGNLRCNITSTENTRPYSVYNESIYGQEQNVAEVVSGEVESYTFNISLWNPTQDVLEVLDKLKAIYDEIVETQLTQRNPVWVKTDDTVVYRDVNEVFVVVDSFSYKFVGTNRTLIDIAIEASIHGIPTTSGGTIFAADRWGDLGLNISSFGITEFMVVEGMVGE